MKSAKTAGWTMALMACWFSSLAKRKRLIAALSSEPMSSVSWRRSSGEVRISRLAAVSQS